VDLKEPEIPHNRLA